MAVTDALGILIRMCRIWGEVLGWVSQQEKRSEQTNTERRDGNAEWSPRRKAGTSWWIRAVNLKQTVSVTRVY